MVYKVSFFHIGVHMSTLLPKRFHEKQEVLEIVVPSSQLQMKCARLCHGSL